ncbi:hypothetical protein [Sulfolobus islandicus rod-shaped virus 2]|uniref:Uncharacterized protein n=1 Tax=Sulfolobus islandicus rod-shaped virus 2 TaxID=157899 RepID=Q8V9Q9_SIRV2|nr:hypothetical protein SIRV2gp09 [Sulfolobus islandicus rod-shaped virus 2]CAC87284.1 hypothetical protein [Sulfolobus islandicus rod-shaped virus 2]
MRRKLGKRQIDTIRRFFAKLQKYQILTDTPYEICERKHIINKNQGKLVIFEDESLTYNLGYGRQVINNLLKKGIFYEKKVKDPKINRKVKVICINKDYLPQIQNLINNNNK